MLQVQNRTPFAASLAVFPDPGGVETAYGAVKASFELAGEHPRLASRQAALLGADVYWGDPATSSLRAAGEVTLCKPGTDVLLIGHAIAAAPTEVMQVSLRAGPVDKSVQVYGRRRWVRRAQQWAIGDPEPFERMPLRWELAFGGMGRSVQGRALEQEARNPVGTGFIASDDDRVEGRALPNLEDPREPIEQPHDRPSPAGFGPVAPAWLPRRSRAGTYDASWQRTRAPYLPADFDPRFLNAAPEDQIVPGRLIGGETVEIRGCTAAGHLRFFLPAVRLALQWEFDGRSIDGEAELDTVLIEPDLGRLQMLWRGRLAVDKKVLRLRRLSVDCPGFPAQRKAA